MNFNGALSGLTFLGHPIIAGILIRYLGSKRINNCLKIVFPFFLVCDIAYCFKYSFSGDYADEIILSLQYLALCIFVENIKQSRNIIREIIRIGGYLVLAAFGFFGMVMAGSLLSGSGDYSHDKDIAVRSTKYNYLLRHDGMEFFYFETSYSFTVYQCFDFVPIEKLVGMTRPYDYEDVLPSESKIAICDSSNGKKYLVTRLTNDSLTFDEIK